MDEKEKNIRPPQWADRFFEWYCNPDMQEEILGDLYEGFMEKASSDSLWKAKAWYWAHVFLFINRHTLAGKRNFLTPLYPKEMLSNYFKTGYRNIKSNRLTSIINVIGMALAIGCCLTVFQFMDWLYHADDFHSNRDQIYIVQREVDVNGERGIWNDAPKPIGHALKSDFPQIEEMTRVDYESGIVRFEDQVFNESISFIDEAFYHLFDFPVKWGVPSNFMKEESVVLSEGIAKKYFGGENPLGKELEIHFSFEGKESVKQFIVRGVLEKIPQGASFTPSILIPFHHQKDIGKDPLDWATTSDMTFVLASDPNFVATVKNSEQKYIDRVNQANKGWQLAGLYFQPFKDVVRTSYDVNNSPFFSVHPIGQIMFTFIAVVMLLLVCFNYINITLASASKRLKEISIRKVMGGSRKQIIVQFLLENVLICTLALAVGVLLAIFLFLPWFYNLTSLDLRLDYLNNQRIWLFTIGLILLTALGGAGYPAFYISRFQPVAIMKKNFRIGSKSFFRKLLVGGQLFFTLLTIFATIAFLFTSKEIKQRDWGYQQNDLVSIRLQDATDFEEFTNELQRQPDIVSVAGSNDHLGLKASRLTVSIQGEDYAVEGFNVGPSYIETTGIRIKSGRSFSEDLETDQVNSIIVNETFSKELNWESSVGKSIVIADQQYRIIGEVEDFHHVGFFEAVKPMVLSFSSKDQLEYVSIKTTPGTQEAVAKSIEKTWKQIYPFTPYNFTFQEAAFDNYYYGLDQLNAILSAASFLTIIVAIIGLFGLAMLLINQKMKELSIRKVLGANLFQISNLISKEFMFPLVFSVSLGLPLGYMLTSALIEQASPGTGIGVLPFVLTVLMLVSILCVSIVRQIYLAANNDPTKFLHDD